VSLSGLRSTQWAASSSLTRQCVSPVKTERNREWECLEDGKWGERVSGVTVQRSVVKGNQRWFIVQMKHRTLDINIHQFGVRLAIPASQPQNL
jgi:hypothetical protein